MDFWMVGCEDQLKRVMLERKKNKAMIKIWSEGRARLNQADSRLASLPRLPLHEIACWVASRGKKAVGNFRLACKILRCADDNRVVRIKAEEKRKLQEDDKVDFIMPTMNYHDSGAWTSSPVARKLERFIFIARGRPGEGAPKGFKPVDFALKPPVSEMFAFSYKLDKWDKGYANHVLDLRPLRDIRFSLVKHNELFAVDGDISCQCPVCLKPDYSCFETAIEKKKRREEQNSTELWCEGHRRHHGNPFKIRQHHRFFH